MLTDRFWGYGCSCKYPFHGKDCELQFNPNAKEVELCADNQCQNGATCVENKYSTAGGFFEDNSPQDLLTANMVPAPAYKCTCKPGFYGYFCEKPIRRCEDNPCAPGSYCQASGSAPFYTCTCPCGLAGDNCEITAINHNINNVWNGVGANVLNFCSDDREVCLNGGTCVNHIQRQRFECLCPAGRRGTRCELVAVSAAYISVPSTLLVAVAAVVAVILNH